MQAVRSTARLMGSLVWPSRGSRKDVSDELEQNFNPFHGYDTAAYGILGKASYYHDAKSSFVDEVGADDKSEAANGQRIRAGP
jgi:hypothetical protein